MCGIAGFIKGGTTTQLELMLRAIQHRGPDGSGTFAEKGMLIGHRRLSIIDLSESGAQPMQGTRFVVSYNGEIYNFPQIKSSLKKTNYAGNSDTEVLLALLEERGVAALNELRGIFSFFAFDRSENCVYLVRDRLGVKPLYMYRNGRSLAFSSEAKAFAAAGLPLTLNKQKLIEHFRYRYVAGMETVIREVTQVLPGTYVKIELDHYREEEVQYWAPALKPELLTLSDALSRFEEVFLASVKRQLISDAPLGAQLSGGIDSSLVVAAIRKVDPERELHTFHINSVGAGFSEAHYANQVAKRFRSHHHAIDMDQTVVARQLESAVVANDFPLAHPNSIGIYLLSQHARETQGIKVLMSGEGADELFCGYTRYSELKRFLSIYRLPAGRLRDFALHRFSRNRHFDFALNEARDVKDLVMRSAGPVSSQDIFAYFDRAWEPSQDEYKRQLLDFSNGQINGASLLDTRTYMESLLHRQDYMSMQAGVENRVPFLDEEVVDFAFTVPEKFKLHGATTKFLIKKYAETMFDKDFVYRPKQGFSVSLRPMLEAIDLRSWLGPIAESGIFNVKRVTEDISKLEKGTPFYVDHLFNVITVQMWLQAFNITADHKC